MLEYVRYTYGLESFLHYIRGALTFETLKQLLKKAITFKRALTFKTLWYSQDMLAAFAPQHLDGTIRHVTRVFQTGLIQS